MTFSWYPRARTGDRPILAALGAITELRPAFVSAERNMVVVERRGNFGVTD
jgi:hypothetical protein